MWEDKILQWTEDIFDTTRMKFAQICSQYKEGKEGGHRGERNKVKRRRKETITGILFYISYHITLFGILVPAFLTT